MNKSLGTHIIILTLYMLQLSMLSTNTLGKQLREFTSENKLAQHIVNFVTVMVLLSIYDTSKNTISLLRDSTFIYFLYILTTKLDLQFNLIIITSLLMLYFYKREINIREQRIINDFELSSDIKNNIIGKNENIFNLYNMTVLCILIYFVYIYFARKNIQYGGGFSYSKFILE